MDVQFFKESLVHPVRSVRTYPFITKKSFHPRRCFFTSFFLEFMKKRLLLEALLPCMFILSKKGLTQDGYQNLPVYSSPQSRLLLQKFLKSSDLIFSSNQTLKKLQTYCIPTKFSWKKLTFPIKGVHIFTITIWPNILRRETFECCALQSRPKMEK